MLLRRLFKYCALPPPCIDRSGASRRGGLSNTISGEGVRVVGVGSIVSGLAEPPRTLSPFLRNLHLTIQRTIETPRESLPQELSTSRALQRVCSWVRVGAAPTGPFPACARTPRGRLHPVNSLISPSAARDIFTMLARAAFDCLPVRDQGLGPGRSHKP